jgi:hypothetical protein
MDLQLRDEKAARLCASIIRERWFGDRSPEVGYRLLCLLIRGGDPWADEPAQEIRRTLKAFEAGAIDEPELGDWVSSWAALARGGDEPDGPTT